MERKYYSGECQTNQNPKAKPDNSINTVGVDDKRPLYIHVLTNSDDRISLAGATLRTERALAPAPTPAMKQGP